MDIGAISVGPDPPKDIYAVIEIPLGGAPVKYELDKASGALMVDRFLHTAMFYPGNYGFIPQTLSADGDPCDVLVVTQVQVVPGAIVRCRPVRACPLLRGHSQLPRSAADHVRADRALLSALQGPGKGQMGHHRQVARRERR
jgi:hypothetical protein